jgi:hypothetical protein
VKTTFLGSLALGLIGMGGVAMAGSPITYDVDITGAPESITGTITTNGAIGTLPAADITGWNFAATGAQSFSISSADTGAYLPESTLLSATASALSFNFGATGGFIFDDPSSQNGAFVGLYGHNAPNSTPSDAIYVATCTNPLCNFAPKFSLVDNYPKVEAVIGAVPTVSAVPEPATLSLFGLGLAAVALTQRRRVRTLAT